MMFLISCIQTPSIIWGDAKFVDLNFVSWNVKKKKKEENESQENCDHKIEFEINEY